MCSSENELIHDVRQVHLEDVIMTNEVPGSMTEELKSCPFCGEKSNLYIGQPWDGGDYRVLCTMCRCASGGRPTRPEAIAAWNTRTGDKS